MKYLATACLALLSTLAFSQTKSIYGFTRENAESEFKLEDKFDAQLKAANLDEWLKKLSLRPHHVGSAYGKVNAEYMRDLFKSWGYDAQIESYQILFPTPKVRVLEMTAPTKFVAKLVEPPLKEDATAAIGADQLPVYNAWSADGDVTAELVYVNYGVPADYEQLARMDIDVKGKIVIARYGGSWRGIKPKVAQEHGAIGCIIYSDPMDDGYMQGDVYPKGGARPKDGAQRGSVMDMPVYPGDPLTPNVGSTPDARRLNRSEVTNLIRIPVLPISYGDAQPILAALGGPLAPWKGGLPITYHIGPGPVKVHLKVESNWTTVDALNVIAKMKGSEFPDEWIVRGNHHDGWNNGAADPLSGLVAEMEEARAIGELVKGGWKPKRTIVYCAWDAEEPGLMGSTEWVEHHAQELQAKVVAYINSDGNGRGFLGVQGSHTFETLMTEVSRDVMDPETGVSVFERGKSRAALYANNAKSKKEALGRRTLVLGAMGSGSDYTPFIQHLGIPSMNIGYGGEGSGGGGVYHSVYDTYDHYVRYVDGKFDYGVALAKTAGRTTLRLAGADVLPFDFKSFHRTVNGYLNEVTALLESIRESTEVENQLIRENRYALAADPKEKIIPPTAKEPVPFLNFASLQNALSTLEKSANQYADLIAANPKPNTNVAELNRLLYQAEQKLLSPSGLPRRPWFRHTIYAPGFYTGYGVKTLPGVREAIEERNWKEAQDQIEIAATAIDTYARQIDAASKVLMMR